VRIEDHLRRQGTVQILAYTDSCPAQRLPKVRLFGKRHPPAETSGVLQEIDAVLWGNGINPVNR
jgi:hypothetical protein